VVTLRSAVCLLFLLSLAPVAFAAGKDDVSLDTASLDKDVTSVYGTDCEKVKPGEARSTVRVRVTDKASYLAVSSLPDLRNAKVELNEHDFNVMVYNLVDNNIEDMAIRTTKQTPEEICVEVTGYISGKNIFAAIDEALDRQKNGEEDNVTAENGGLAPSDLAETENGPQPEAEAKPEQPAKTDLAEKEPLYTPDESIPPPPVSESQTPSAEQEKEDYLQAKAASKGLIYITPTEFFNKTTSAKYAEISLSFFSYSLFDVVAFFENLCMIRSDNVNLTPEQPWSLPQAFFLSGCCFSFARCKKTVFICCIAALSFWRPIILKRIISE
jgi:hypothetical protein